MFIGRTAPQGQLDENGSGSLRRFMTRTLRPPSPPKRYAIAQAPRARPLR